MVHGAPCFHKSVVRAESTESDSQATSRHGEHVHWPEDKAEAICLPRARHD